MGVLWGAGGGGGGSEGRGGVVEAGGDALLCNAEKVL